MSLSVFEDNVFGLFLVLPVVSAATATHMFLLLVCTLFTRPQVAKIVALVFCFVFKKCSRQLEDLTNRVGH